VVNNFTKVDCYIMEGIVAKAAKEKQAEVITNNYYLPDSCKTSCSLSNKIFF